MIMIPLCCDYGTFTSRRGREEGGREGDNNGTTLIHENYFNVVFENSTHIHREDGDPYMSWSCLFNNNSMSYSGIARNRHNGREKRRLEG